ncbi:phosphatidate cytidylyltransferase, photoreceptor-specific-like [Sitophilus oryzae]|uniref:Phosphatidate cytidylyltransferase n=1 Tax=Sitophilus oryzae TaxID=7048 RepID=A0A6J2YC17_SITOR|nr:phosphatidate cytidylyltransferase, photoreceptor-specific-like [Sitophilus oryzae]
MTSSKPEAVIKKNWVQRTVTATVLILGFIVVIYIGVPALLVATLAIQVKCFQEIITIAYNYKKLPEIPLFRTLNWYFLFVLNYFFFGEAFSQYLDTYIKKYHILESFFAYHRFLTFCLYMVGLIWFLNLLRKKVIRQQFTLLAWTHFLGIIIVLQSYMVVQNMFEGIIWLVLPISLVFLNDIFSYIFGKLYGKTPLIKLSPKKTLEGFFGGVASTVILGTLLAYILCHFEYLLCPTKFVDIGNSINMITKCTPSDIFQPITIDFKFFSVCFYPFLLHVQFLALFASLIAPFGGFCASGFKRAFNMKDFGDSIPGHGGVMDRFDCQYLMATFVNVYIISFIRSFTVEKIFAKVLSLNDAGQLEFYNLLEDNLKLQGLID